MEHTQSMERAKIYDYQTSEEIRQATAKEEWRYIAQLLSMTGSQRTIGAVDGDEYGHDGIIYMQGGRVRSPPYPWMWIMTSAARLRSESSASRTDEFMRYSGTDNIREVETTSTTCRRLAGGRTEDLADMAAYIERDVRMACSEGLKWQNDTTDTRTTTWNAMRRGTST